MIERNNNNCNILASWIPAVPKCTNDPLLGIIPGLMIIRAFRNFNVCAIGWPCLISLKINESNQTPTQAQSKQQRWNGFRVVVTRYVILVNIRTKLDI